MDDLKEMRKYKLRQEALYHTLPREVGVEEIMDLLLDRLCDDDQTSIWQHCNVLLN
jgi:hypothetical protein